MPDLSPDRKFSARGRSRWPLLLCWSALGLLVAAIGWACSRGSVQQPAVFGPDEIAHEFCIPIAPEAKVADGVAADVAVKVQVPAKPPDSVESPNVLRIRKGDVVEFTITSPVPGAAGVHGMSDIVAIRSGQIIRLRFRAIYDGRFPLHFHGIDQSHYELLVLEIRD